MKEKIKMFSKCFSSRISEIHKKIFVKLTKRLYIVNKEHSVT